MQERIQPPSVDNLTESRRAIEAMLLVANDPTPVQLLAQLVELPVDLVQSMCRELAGEYEAERRGFQLAEVAGGWRFQTHPDTHAYVERFALEGIPNRLSSAALETLAIVAYKQPISRAQVGAIRGVNVDGVLRTLVQRGYVDEQGRDDGPGQATLFGTTPFFLEQLGLMSVDDLPPLGDFVPSVEVLEALENTLRVDPEPEIVIIEDGDGGAPADATVTADPQTEPSADAEDQAEPVVDADADADAESGDAAHEAGLSDQAEPDDRVEPETPEPEVANGSSNGSSNGSGHGSSNGSSNGSSTGLVALSNDDAGEDAVYEIIGDPAASVIPLATHLANSTNGAPSADAETDIQAEIEADTEIEAEVGVEVETDVEADGDAAPDADLVEGDAVDDDTAEDELAPEMVDEQPSGLIDDSEPESDLEVEVEPDVEPEPEPESKNEAEQMGGGWLEPAPSDELEVTADPEVDQTDGPTETGAAGADDARFPGPGHSQPTDAPGSPDPGPQTGGRMGQGTSSAPHRGGPTPDASPSWPETLTNGHRVDPESGDA